MRSLSDTPHTGNRARESGSDWQSVARQCVARTGTADTPHPFAGAAVCEARRGISVQCSDEPITARCGAAWQCRAWRSKHAAHLRVRGSLLWSSHANLGVAGSGDAMLHTPRIRESARKWERLVMAVQYVAKLGDADTQRPAMAVAVCADWRGRAYHGLAMQGKADTQRIFGCVAVCMEWRG